MTECVRKRLLVWGIALGFALMLVDAFSLNIRFDSVPLAAKMTGGKVTQAQLKRALSKVGGAAEGHARQQVLEFLIDEELLVLRAKTVGLVESDRTIRKALSRAVIDQQVKEAIAYAPTEDELRQFYDNHRALFTVEEKIHLTQLFFKKMAPNRQGQGVHDLNAKARGEATRRALLEGDKVNPLDDPLLARLPETLIPVSIMHRTLGPSLAAQVRSLRPGQVSKLIESEGGYHIFVGQNFVDVQLRAYEAVKGDVLAEYRRRARDKMLEKKLHTLLAQSDIRIAKNLSIDISQLSQ